MFTSNAGSFHMCIRLHCNLQQYRESLQFHAKCISWEFDNCKFNNFFQLSIDANKTKKFWKLWFCWLKLYPYVYDQRRSKKEDAKVLPSTINNRRRVVVVLHKMPSWRVHGGGVLCCSKSSKLLVCAQFVYTNAEALNHM